MENCDISQAQKSHENCKNHPNVSSGYFLSDQPSIKYCKNCALNVALCGRKIEKILSLEQEKRKSQITTVVNELKRQLDVISTSKKLNKQAETYYSQIGKPFQQKIKEIERSIGELVQLKEKLCKNYEKKIVRQRQNLVKARQLYSNSQLQIERLLQKVESNFGNLIEAEDSHQIQKQLEECKQVIAKNAENVMNQQMFAEIKAKVWEQVHQLFQICDKISLFRVNFQEVSYKVLFPLEENKQNFVPMMQLNCLQSSRLVEQLKINLTANAQLKSKNTKKVATDRDHQFGKRSNRKQSIANEGLSDWVVPTKKVHQK